MSDPWASPFQTETDAYQVSADADTPWGVVHVDGAPVPIQGQVGVTLLGTMPQRLTFGDHTLASDQFLSVWVISDLTGGGQVEDLREASHAQRYRHGTLDATHPRMLTQPLETLSYTITSATDATPIGDYDDDADGTSTFWAAFDIGATTVIRPWDATSANFATAADTMTAFPVGAMKGVVFDDLLWIPLGSSGYDTWDGTNIVNSTTVTPIAFAIWDDKLVCLEHDGQVSLHQSGTSATTGWDVRPDLKLKGGEKARNLVLWWSQDGFPTLYVVTSKRVWAVDFLVPKLYPTGLKFPTHPDHGLAATSWRDDAMYVSVGVGVHQLSRGIVISAMGLDRDDGMPGNLRGRIVDFEPEYNGLLALVEGIGTVAVGSDTTLGPETEETMLLDDPFIVPVSSTQARSTLQRWTGIGWHTVWESEGALGTPTRVYVSEADGAYTLWWGYAGSMYKQVLRRSFYNPRQGAELGIDRFAAASSLKTGRFDANLPAFHKLASHIEVHLDDLSTGEVDIYYSNDHFAGWKLLGTVSGTGQQYLLFDPDGDGFEEGDPFHWIEFDIRLRNTVATETVIINWISLYFLVMPLQARSWRLPIPLGFDEEWMGRGAQEIMDQFDDLVSDERFITFKHRDRMYRTKVAQTQGTEATGKDHRGTRLASLLQIGPQGEDA